MTLTLLLTIILRIVKTQLATMGLYALYARIRQSSFSRKTKARMELLIGCLTENIKSSTTDTLNTLTV